MVSRVTSGLQDERNKVDVWISIKFDLLCSFGHVTWAGAGCSNDSWAGRAWRDNGVIKVRGGTILIKVKIHACMFHLAIHHASEGWNGLLDVSSALPFLRCWHHAAQRRSCRRHMLSNSIGFWPYSKANL